MDQEIVAAITEIRYMNHKRPDCDAIFSCIAKKMEKCDIVRVKDAVDKLVNDGLIEDKGSDGNESFYNTSKGWQHLLESRKNPTSSEQSTNIDINDLNGLRSDVLQEIENTRLQMRGKDDSVCENAPDDFERSHLYRHMKEEIEFLRQEIRNKDEMVKLVFLNKVPHMIPNINQGATRSISKDAEGQSSTRVESIGKQKTVATNNSAHNGSIETVNNAHIVLEDITDNDIQPTKTKHKNKSRPNKRQRKKNRAEASTKNAEDPACEGDQAVIAPSTTSIATDKARKSEGNCKPRSIHILGDSMLKNLNSWNFNKDCPSGDKVIVKSFSGSTTKDMHSYVIPSIEKGPDCIVLHVGTNDLPDAKKSDVNIAQGIIALAKKIREDKIEVKVSGLVPRYDKHEPKRVKVNYILRDLCSENSFAYFDHSNIDPANHLNRSKLHLNKDGSKLFADNLLNAIMDF